VRSGEIYRRVGEERTLWSTISQRIRWVGHVVRDSRNVGSIMEGETEEKVTRGRSRERYLRQVKRDTGTEGASMGYEGKEGCSIPILRFEYYNNNQIILN
jgi:hypothetical protein